jgi:L-amino acid N-acyltransferase YncA
MNGNCESPVSADGYTLGPLEDTDGRPVIDLFNHYVEHSFAAYPESPVPYEFFDHFLAVAEEYPTVAVRDGEGRLVGFGMLRPHNPMPAPPRSPISSGLI